MNKKLAILGTRGVPAAHGGFETFAEALSLFLVAKGWEVTVYCQVDDGDNAGVDEWNGVRRVKIFSGPGALGTIKFDFNATLHSRNFEGVVLTLGYNTAVFCAIYRLYGTPNVINMDGIEWKRQKWSFLARLWLLGNEYLGAKLGNHLVADHPGIKSHLRRYVENNKITMIPYGSDRVDEADVDVLGKYGLAPDGYAILIARPEPENSILEVVEGWSKARRNIKLVVLGKYINGNEYHQKVLNAASEDVIFLGAIYEKSVVAALRYFARFYVHGHQVGGTNPSLVEALGAGNAIIAHDNLFNRWVAGDSARYFSSSADVSSLLEELNGGRSDVAQLKTAARIRHSQEFVWDAVLDKYQELLERYMPVV